MQFFSPDPEVILAMADGYWREMWEEWFRPLSKDCLKTFSILAVLYAFWEVIALMRFRGYSDVYLQALEKTHFVFMWLALTVIGGSFVIKLLVGTWQTKHGRQNERSSRIYR